MRFRPAWIAVSVMSLATVATVATVATERTADAAPGHASRLVERTTLANGLRVVLFVDHAAPTVAIDVVYDVGSRDEERGRSGLARLVGRLMLGGDPVDGATTADHTSFHAVLPASELALGLWREANRMRALEVTPTSFEAERAVAKEAYRGAVENAALGPASVRLAELVYRGFWPYEHGPLGSLRDLEAAAPSWARAFHDAHYAPNAAVVAVVGDFDAAEGLALVKRYFGDIPRRTVSVYTPPNLPDESGPRSAVVEDVRARLPAVLAGWMIPASPEADHYALVLAARLLADGESSRLRRSLVRERGVAIDVSACTDDRRGPDLFTVKVKLASGARVDQVTKLVEAQVADLGRSGPTDDELHKLQNRLRQRHLFTSNLTRASELAQQELDRGDRALADAELDKYLAVGREDIKRAVTRYLTNARRSTVEVKPGEKN